MAKSVAFLVDGDLEKRALEKCCRGAPIRKLGNGDDYPTRVIVKQIMTQVRLLGNRYRHVAVLLDREDRVSSCEAFADEILTGLEEAGIGRQSITVHIKDREAEDWIMADRESLAAFLGEPIDTEGLAGKNGLKHLLRQYNIKYSEVAIGADLLASVVCSRAAEVSPSLRAFRETFPEDCWWLDR